MDQILSAIPNGFASIPSDDRFRLEEFSDSLQHNLKLLPHSNLYTADSTHAGTTREIFKLFKMLDRIMYNIGINEHPYKEMYFVTTTRSIDGIDLKETRFQTESAIASTKIIIDQDFSSTDTIHYDLDTFTELKAINLHLQETNRHLVRVFKANNILIVLTNKVSWKMIFKIKALNCKLFKDSFPTYNTDVEKAYTALATDDLNEFSRILNKILNYKTWFKYKRARLATCFQNQKDYQLARKTQQIDDVIYNTERAEEKYKALLIKLQQLKEEYNVLLNIDDNIDTDEILDYIERHHYIKDITKIGETTLELHIEAPLIYFDEDYIEDYKGYPNTDIKYVMEEVFLKKKYRLWTRSRIQLNTNNFNTGALNINPVTKHFMPQPHLSRYGCQGNHPTQIRKWIETYDYIGCIEQIMVMACNINWTDGIVINEMFRTLTNIATCKTFEVVETGEFVSLNDILATREEK